MKTFLWIVASLVLIAACFTVLTSPRQPLTEVKSPHRENETPSPIPASPLDAISLSLTPPVVMQGEPVLISVDGPVNTSAITWLTFDDDSHGLFENDGRLSLLVGIELHKKPGLYPVVLTLADGRTIEKTLEVRERVMPTKEFAIPESFGGNTPQGEQELTSNLVSDTATLNKITGVVSPEKLWEGSFRYPRDEPIVITDTYGYSRQTGSVNLSHNGTDFRAAVGTSVYAMNGGIVVFSGSFRNYGNTVVIDHGLGVMTMYMHLSELLVELDQIVEKSALIAKSGNTGYSLAPHLHLSVRIGGFSIDPIKFLELMGAE